MSRLRPTLRPSDCPVPTKGTAYLVVYNAVHASPGLIHGKLDGAHGEHCAIGWAFASQTDLVLLRDFIDEVALVNDSVPPSMSAKWRKQIVLRWLRWELKEIGMPGFAAAKPPDTEMGRKR